MQAVLPAWRRAQTHEAPPCGSFAGDLRKPWNDGSKLKFLHVRGQRPQCGVRSFQAPDAAADFRSPTRCFNSSRSREEIASKSEARQTTLSSNSVTLPSA